MSYDFYIAVDTGGAEPHYIDHPEGNYTSNVSGMWAKCLTAALRTVPDAQRWCGEDDRYCLEKYGSTIRYVDGTTAERTIATDRLCLRDLKGKPAGELVPLLRAAVAWGFDHLDELREDNPSNGWGDADGAVLYLDTIRTMCEEHPRGILEISS